MVHLDVVVEDAPTERAPEVLGTENDLAHLDGAATTLGTQELIQDLVGQRGQSLGIPGDGAWELGQPGLYLILAVKALFYDTGPLTAVQVLCTLIL